MKTRTLLHSLLLLVFVATAPLVMARDPRPIQLGPVGATFSLSVGQTNHTLRVVSVTPGGPGATAGLQVGDIIYSAFDEDLRGMPSEEYVGAVQDIGEAIERAEANNVPLPLKVVRPGVGGVALSITLPNAGAFGAAYPLGSPKFDAIYEAACAQMHTLVTNSGDGFGYQDGWLGLCLLSHTNWNDTAGPKPFRNSINKIRDWAVTRLNNALVEPLEGNQPGFVDPGLENWALSTSAMFLGSYRLKSGDASVDATVQRAAELLANRVQYWPGAVSPPLTFRGRMGHGGVEGDYDEGGINIINSHAYVAMALLKLAGADFSGPSGTNAGAAPESLTFLQRAQLSWAWQKENTQITPGSDIGNVGYQGLQEEGGWDSCGRTAGAIAGFQLWNLTPTADDTQKLNLMQGYLAPKVGRFMNSHVITVSGVSFYQMALPFLADRDQRFIMENTRYYYQLQRKADGTLSYLPGRMQYDSDLAMNAEALPLHNTVIARAIAGGTLPGFPLTNTTRLNSFMKSPWVSWPTLAAHVGKINGSTPATLDVEITDYAGVPVTSGLTAAWTKISGPGTVTFGSPAALTTTATFSADGLYRVQLIASKGGYTLTEPYDFTVTLNPPNPPAPVAPVITVQPVSVTRNLGDSATFTVTVTGTGPFVYEWRRNGVSDPNWPVTSTADLVLNNIGGGVAGSYDCVITGPGGTTNSSAGVLTISDAGVLTAGGLWREKYNGLATFGELHGSIRFPRFPDSGQVITNADAPYTAADAGGYFGTRWTGWLHVDVAGDYRLLATTGGEAGGIEVSLSTDQHPTNKTLRVSAGVGDGGYRVWSSAPASSYSTLTAGQRYYLEVHTAMLAEGLGAAVLLQKQGDPLPASGTPGIPGSQLEYLTGGVFSDYVSFFDPAPTITCSTNISTTNDLGQCSALVGFTNAVTGASESGVVCTLTNVLITSPHVFTVGTNLVVCTATNVVGTNSCMFTVTVRDVTHPALVGVPANATYQCLGDVPALPVVTATDNCGPLPVLLTCTTNGTCPVLIACNWTAIDKYGNGTIARRTNTIRDTLPPMLVGVPASASYQCLGDVPPLPTVTATDNCGPVSVVTTCTTNGTCPLLISCTWTATDSCTNVTTATWTFTVQDTTPPVVTCPANLSFTLPDGVTSTNVTFAASATDNCAVLSTNCTPPSGSAFPVGTNTVNCSATDACTNTASCSFTITVISTSSNVPPMITCQTNISTTNDLDQCSALVSFTNTVTGSPAPGVVCTLSNVVVTSPHAFTVGTNLVVCTATNVAGTNSCMFTVTVRDAQATVLVGVPSSASYQCLSEVSLPTVTATDNCGPLPVTLVCTTNGTCPVVISCTWSANDGRGNGRSSQRTFTIRDTLPPVITCPANIAATAASGTTSATVTFAATATDNCGAVTPVCTPSSGSAFPVGTNTVNCAATDACTNSASCSFTITVAPVPVEDFGCVISHWKFDEASGNTALDSVDGNPGTLMNGPARVPGHIGSGALEFNGVNQYVNLPNSASLNVPQNFSISLWFRPGQTLNAASGRKDLFKKFLSYWVILNYPGNDGKLAFVLNSGGAIVKSTTTSWTAGQWYHVAATHDGVTMRLYVNGVLENSSVVGVSAASGTSPVQIGGNTEQGYWFPGAIDDARLFCTNLTAGSVQSLFNGSTNPPPVNTPPVISDIASRTIGANSDTGPIPFTVGDAETPAASLVVSATSSNTVLVPNANFIFNGTGSNRTVRVFPAPTQTGMTLVTITVSDGSLTTNDTFLLTVTNAPPPPPAGTNQLISRWQFDEATGNTALDLNGVNNGTLVNGPARVGPKVGTGALQFNGVNQYVNVPDSSSLDLSNRFTIAFWMRPSQLLNASSGRRDLVQKFLSYWVILNYPGSDGRLAFVLNSGTPIAKSTTTSWNAGQWYHVAATYDGAIMRLYINGIMEGSTPSVFLPNNSSSPLQFGGNTTQNYWFPGALDDVRLYGNPLSAASILDVMNGLSPLLPPGGIATIPATMAITVETQNDLIVLNWNAQAGRSYRVEYKDGLAGSDWSELPGEITVTGTTARAEDTLGLSTQRFYRVVIEP